MEYLQLTFPIRDTEFTEIESRLSQAGALSITTSDAEDQPILEPRPGETPLWKNLIITALFQANKNRRKVEARLGQRPLQWTLLEEQDWERAWLKDYEPIQFAKTLWVGPQDFEPPADMKATLFLDPGLAFGTGSHPTTYLCLEWLSQQDLKGQTLLDFGCGSGILALAALKLGAKHVLGTDIDPQALEASAENAKRNDIDEAFCSWILTDALHHQDEAQVDILIANILANPLITLSSRLISFLKKGSMLVLSGILEEQADAVKAAYLNDIHWTETKIKDGWTRLAGQKT